MANFQIDILVNNAGRTQNGLLKDFSFENHREILDLNLIGTISLTKAILPHMLANKTGHIVFNNSVAGKIGKHFVSES